MQINKKKKILFLSIVLIVLLVVFFISYFFIFVYNKDTNHEESDSPVDINNEEPEKEGTTLLSDNHIPENPRIIEINMQGEIIWEYSLPDDLKQYNNPGFDAELLPNNNILFLLPRKGIYEINRDGNIIWSHLDEKISHDADRLENGNTLYVFGGEDKFDDAQAKEVNQKGEIVWSWYAKNHFFKQPYKDIYEGGWTHTNAADRLSNGNTIISLRNFNMVVEVDKEGEIVRTIGEGVFHKQHDPEFQTDGNLLIANHSKPHSAIIINPNTNEILWQYKIYDQNNRPVRDADILPNGNILITGSTKILEVTKEGEIVWQYTLDATLDTPDQAAGQGFYKAQRIYK